MKKSVRLVVRIFIFVFGLLIYSNVFATETINSINITLNGTISTGDGEHTIFRKYANNTYNAYCIDGFDKPINEITCTYAGKSIEFGAIIKAATNGHTGSSVSDSEYLLAQAALAIKNKNNTAYMPQSLIDNANAKITAAQSDITKQKSAIKLTKTTDFTLKDDNYIATFTATGGDSIKSVSGCSAKDSSNKSIEGTNISINGSVVSVSIPKNKLDVGETNITLTCTDIVKNYYASQYFTCSGDYQDISLAREKWEETGSASATATINIEQKKGSIKVIKKGKDSKVLEGVKFQIKNSKGKTINATGKEEVDYIFTTDKDGIIEAKDIELNKTATENVYTIEEIETLPGYIKYKTVTKVTLTEGKLDITKTIVNDIIKVTISKTDATGEKEIKGAKLSILDKNGKVLKKCIFDDENNLITYSDSDEAKACTWVSTDKSKIVEGIPIGKYYLVEELAPTGYTKSSEKIEIEVTEDGAVKDKIVMKNALEVKVPDTLSGKSALLLAIAMFDVALGIGIYIYVKNNKVEE